MAKDGLPSAREHIDKVMGDLVAKGAIQPDADAASLARGIPTFSKGTLALDENTGQPVGATPTLPGFTDGGVAIPDGVASGGAVGGNAPSATVGKTAEELLAEHQARIGANGAATPGTAAATAAAGEAAPGAQAPAEQQAGASAAEAAAEALADAFAEYEEIEVEDADLETKYPIRVPKAYATSAKRGYGRRSTFDRGMSYLKNAEPVLRDLIANGQINQLLPLIQRALNDPAYGDYVLNGYQRAQQGLPLIEQARQEAAAAAVAPPPPATDPAFSGFQDPFLGEQMAPVLQRLDTLQQRIDREDADRRTAAESERQRQVQQQQQNQRAAQDMQLAHQDIARIYPEARVDLGAKDPLWVKAVQYAKDAGYVDAYGLRAGIVFGAQQAAAIEAERLAATGSPAAAAIAQMEGVQMNLARSQAAAASRTVGAGAPTQAAPAPPPREPATKNPDGSMKRPEVYMREMQQYLNATHQPA